MGVIFTYWGFKCIMFPDELTEWVVRNFRASRSNTFSSSSSGSSWDYTQDMWTKNSRLLCHLKKCSCYTFTPETLIVQLGCDILTCIVKFCFSKPWVAVTLTQCCFEACCNRVKKNLPLMLITGQIGKKCVTAGSVKHGGLCHLTGDPQPKVKSEHIWPATRCWKRKSHQLHSNCLQKGF